MKKVIFVEELGISDYLETWQYQQVLFQRLIDKKCTLAKYGSSSVQHLVGHLLFTEHRHVYTLGKNGNFDHLLLDKNSLQKKGIQFYRIDRGGDITYHGLGQLVVYPILDMEYLFKDIYQYLRLLEEVVIRLLAIYGLHGERSYKETGVWLDVGKSSVRKLCSIGIRMSRWVSMHGLALNINPNMTYFKYIIPCGIKGKGVTSMKLELGYAPDIKEIINIFNNIFQEVFHLTEVGSKYHPG